MNLNVMHSQFFGGLCSSLERFKQRKAVSVCLSQALLKAMLMSRGLLYCCFTVVHFQISAVLGGCLIPFLITKFEKCVHYLLFLIRFSFFKYIKLIFLNSHQRTAALCKLIRRNNYALYHKVLVGLCALFHYSVPE